MTVAHTAYTADQIKTRISELALEIKREISSENLLLIGVLKGSVVFLADLIRELAIDSADVDFMSISAYRGSNRQAGPDVAPSSGVVRIVKDLEEPIEGKDVLVVEDIVDTGLTLNYLLRTLSVRNPRSVRVCALLDKTVRRIVEPKVDHSGFKTSDFLVGYGLDFKGRYRNLPYLAAVPDVAALALNPDALVGLLASDERSDAPA